MTSKLSPVPQRVPISDSRGLLAPVWSRWFQDLMTRVGGNSAKTNIELDQSGIISIARGGTGQTTASAGFDALSPTTTKGDLIVRDATSNVRQAIGSDGTLLVSDSTQSAGVNWKTPTSALTFAVVSKTANYTLTTSDYLVLVDASGGSFTLSLPAAASNTGRVFLIKRTDNTLSNAVTLDPNGSETIDGQTTRKLCTQYETVSIISDGSNWSVLEHRCGTAPASYILSIGGSTSAPSPGTLQTNIAHWYRDGGDMVITYQFRQTTAASGSGSGTYLFPLPSGATIDTNRCSLTNVMAGETSIGSGQVFDSVNLFVVSVRPYDSTNLALSDTSTIDVGSGHVSLGAADVRFSFTARIPITDWWA